MGARPQFIKAAPVSRALRSAGISEVLIHTGQHYDDEMSDVFFEELGIPEPAVNLHVGSGRHGWQTGQMLISLEEVFLERRPNWVLVYGDTNSTLAAALAAVKLHIPLAHVEAGLRSFNRSMPEEHNRVLTDHAADLLFCPTKEAVHNLIREGIRQDRVELVGDVMQDAVIECAANAEEQSRILEELSLSPRSYVLATVHRASNTDDATRLRAIFEGLADISTHTPVVLPLHPRTRIALDELELFDRASASLTLVKPLGYLDMITLEKNAQLIATDSGGIQKEAYFHRVPCVTLRCETEWIELVESGWNTICPPVSREAVRAAVVAAIGTEGTQGPDYGDGDAALRIAQSLSVRWEAGVESGV